MKICPACKKQYEDGMKFCPVDGTALIDASESEKSPPSGVTTGKILSGGDVNISSTTNQSITNIQEDDSKKIMTCVVSGRQDVVTEGAICGTCAQWAHKRHFNAKNGECEKCQKEKLENSRSEYRNLFQECIADDDKIDADERRVLEEKASGLGLTPDEVEQIESKVRVKFQSRLFALRSPEEKIRIKKAKTLLLKICDFKNAYEKFKKLSTSLRKDKEVTGLYVMSAIAYKPEEALSILDQNLIYRTDTPRKSFLRICALEALGEDSQASEELKKSLHIFPDDPYLKAKTLERLTDLYLSDEQEDDQLDDMREYSEEINLPENSSDSYISFVSRYYRMAYDDAYTVIDMLDSVEELYYAKIKPIVKDLEKSYWESEKDRIAVEPATEFVEFENPTREESEEIPTVSDTEEAPDDYDTESVPSDDISEDEEIAEEETPSVYEEESGVNGSYLEEESEVSADEETHADEDEQTATDDYSSYNKKTAILVAAVVGCFLIFFNWESEYEKNYLESLKSNPDVKDNTWVDNIDYKGGTYSGEFKNGKPHGRGEWSSSSESYVGEWEDGLKQGLGEYFYNNKDRYEGDFHSDSMHGLGVYYMADGTRFEGEFVKGKLHGRGKQYNHIGNLVTQGVWENGVFTGNSSKAENNKKSSIKTISWNGGTYSGTLKAGKPHGKGIWKTRTGQSYEGEWAYGTYNGYGTYIYGDGSRYEGGFIKGKFHGQGKEYNYKGQLIAEGEWENGVWMGQ